MAQYNVSKNEAKEQGIERVLVGGRGGSSSSSGSNSQLEGYESEKESLSSRYSPDMLPAFNDVLSKVSKLGYEARQASDAQNLNARGFDASHVSGNVFASILGGLEQRRGNDITKVFNTSMGATVKSQEMMQERLGQLDNLIQDEKNRIQQYDQWKTEMEWEREQFGAEMAYKKSSGSGGGGSVNKYAGTLDQINNYLNSVKGEDGYVHPDDMKQVRADFVQEYGESAAKQYIDTGIASTWLTEANYAGFNPSVSEQNAMNKNEEGAERVSFYANMLLEEYGGEPITLDDMDKVPSADREEVYKEYNKLK